MKAFTKFEGIPLSERAPRGMVELTQGADDGTYAVMIWTGKKSEAEAKKDARVIVAKLNGPVTPKTAVKAMQARRSV
jgi:hypothetical protein